MRPSTFFNDTLLLNKCSNSLSARSMVHIHYLFDQKFKYINFSVSSSNSLSDGKVNGFLKYFFVSAQSLDLIKTNQKTSRETLSFSERGHLVFSVFLLFCFICLICIVLFQLFFILNVINFIDNFF